MWKSADSIGIFSILAILSKKSVFRQKKSVDMYEVDMWILEKNLKKLLPNEKSLGEIQYIMVRRILFMEYKTYETDSAIDLERELNERQYEGWVLVNVVWNEDSDCYMATMKRR